MLELAGFAALLLWGVHMVQTGVQRTFGPRLKSILASALRNRVKAFGAGAAVTIALQSSTATAMMVTAFQAGGLVSLAPALSVMLGANVGTTMVVQVLSFNIAAAAPILVLAGVVLFRRAKDEAHTFGRALIGLGLILTALHQFMALLEPVVAAPAAQAFLAQVGGYTPLAVIVAAILTWAAHSSVVTVLLAMSLSSAGVIPLETGVALIVGANLGSSLNPLLEGSDWSDPASQRLPLGNFLNRLAGLVIVMGAFSVLAPWVSRLGPSEARALANFHTLFNLGLALLFLPWIRTYAWLIKRLLPAKAAVDPGAPLYLDAEARATPALALGAATREALRMTDTLEAMLKGLREALTAPSRTPIQEAKQLDDVLDRLNTAIRAYLISLPSEALTADESAQVARILAFATNVEHAGDLVDRNLLGVATRRLKRGVNFSAEGEAELVALVDRLLGNVRTAAAAFVSGDASAARLLVAEKEAFREVESDAVRAHFLRLQSGDANTVDTSSLHLDALRDLKRVNSHLVEGAAYPVLEAAGELLRTRLRPAAGGG